MTQEGEEEDKIPGTHTRGSKNGQKSGRLKSATQSKTRDGCFLSDLTGFYGRAVRSQPPTLCRVGHSARKVKREIESHTTCIGGRKRTRLHVRHGVVVPWVRESFSLRWAWVPWRMNRGLPNTRIPRRRSPFRQARPSDVLSDLYEKCRSSPDFVRSRAATQHPKRGAYRPETESHTTYIGGRKGTRPHVRHGVVVPWMRESFSLRWA